MIIVISQNGFYTLVTFLLQQLNTSLRYQAATYIYFAMLSFIVPNAPMFTGVVVTFFFPHPKDFILFLLHSLDANYQFSSSELSHFKLQKALHRK